MKIGIANRVFFFFFFGENGHELFFEPPSLLDSNPRKLCKACFLKKKNLPLGVLTIQKSKTLDLFLVVGYIWCVPGKDCTVSVSTDIRMVSLLSLICDGIRKLSWLWCIYDDHTCP